MTKVRHDRMMWFDIETSDSDKNLSHAALLEVGITVTDEAGRIVSEKNFVNQLTRLDQEKIYRWTKRRSTAGLWKCSKCT